MRNVLAHTIHARWESRNSWDEPRGLPLIHWEVGPSLPPRPDPPRRALMQAELAVQLRQAEVVGPLLAAARLPDGGWSDALTRYYRNRWRLASSAVAFQQDRHDDARNWAFAVLGPHGSPRALSLSTLGDWFILTSYCLMRAAWPRHLAAITEFFSQVLWCDSLAHCRELDGDRFGGSRLVMPRLLRLSFESLRQEGKFPLAEQVAAIALSSARAFDDEVERHLW